ncbi:MAG TPA: arginase [Candidatus Polarisedimenticolia bacterium]|nr:arginase [Candidatus Polarisedimenticolia bacterium]
MKQVRIIGVPMDLGAGRRGVDMGPSALRIAGVNQGIAALGYHVTDAGNVAVPPPEAVLQSSVSARYLPQIVAACTELSALVRSSLEAGALPVVLGGDHSIAIGSGAGLAAHHRTRGEQVGLIWLDAHTDINTPETSPSGNVHGMPLAALLGRGPAELTHLVGFAPMISPRHTVVVGARSIDPGEKDMIKTLGVRVFTMSDLDERGMGPVIEEAIEIASAGTAGFHATMDMDFIDPSFAPGVGTPERGGATYREAHLAMEKIALSGKILSVEITEVNPLFDTANQTGRLAVDLILSALGKTIL